MPFDWTINPYRGCEFGCKYCYARFTHEFMELRDTEQFEREIYAKRFNLDSFRRELLAIPAGEGICLGTATDPYQPAERKFEVTRRILSAFSQRARPNSQHHNQVRSGRPRHRPAGTDLQAETSYTSSSPSRRQTSTWRGNWNRMLPGRRSASRAFESLRERYSRCRAVQSGDAADQRLASEHQQSRASAARGRSDLSDGWRALPEALRAKSILPVSRRDLPESASAGTVNDTATGAFLDGHYPEKIAERLKEIRERYGLTRKPDGYQPEQWLGEPQLELFSPPS